MRIRTCLLSIFFALGLLAVIGQKAVAGIVISEVLWAGSDLSTSDEWVEIACTGSGSLPLCTLDGWTLTGVNSSGVEVVLHRFGTGSTLGSGSTAVVARLSATESRLLLESEFHSSDLSLPNTKMLLRLRDPEGFVHDTVDDGIGDPFAGSNAKLPEPKASMVRIDLSGSGSLKANWKTAELSLGFDDGAPLLGSPGFLEAVSSASSSQSSSSSFSSSLSSSSSSTQSSASSVASSDSSSTSSAQSSSLLSGLNNIFIDEISVLPIPWMEIRFSGTGSLDLTGWTVRDQVSGVTQPVLLASGSILTESSPLGVATGTGLALLLKRAGGTVQLRDSAGQIIDLLTYPALLTGVSYGRVDAEGPQLLCVPSPGVLNSVLPTPHHLVVQTGQLSAIAPHSVNFQVTSATDIGRSRCSVDFGDGSIVAETCNPASHRFAFAGSYSVTARVIDYCGTTMELTQRVEALEAIATSSSSSPSIVDDSEEEDQNRTSATPVGDATADFTLVRVLPNPDGKDSGTSEWIEIRNNGTRPASIEGWKLVAGKETEYLPAVVIGASTDKRLTGSEAGISLRNESGALVLFDPLGKERSRIEWSQALSGVPVLPMPKLPDHFTVYVKAVIDGDTFDVVTSEGKGYRVRLRGVDAPEMEDKHPVVRSMALEAKNYLRALIENKNIELLFDTKERLDPYGRLLAVGILPNGTSLQVDLLSKGLVWIPERYRKSVTEEETLAEQEAQQAHRGIWIHDVFTKTIQEQDSDTDILSQSGAKLLSYSLIELSGILISEVHGHPRSGEEEWIELVNTGTGALDLIGWSLDDEEGKGSKPWRIERRMPIGAGEMLVFPKSVTKLSINDDGDFVRLIGPDGLEVTRIVVPALKTGQAFAWTGERSVPDPDEAYCITLTPTQNQPNVCKVPVTVAKVKKTTAKKATVSKAKSSAAEKNSFTTQAVNTFLARVALPESPVQMDSIVAESSSGGLALSELFVMIFLSMLAGAVTGGAVAVGVVKKRLFFAL